MVYRVGSTCLRLCQQSTRPRLQRFQTSHLKRGIVLASANHSIASPVHRVQRCNTHTSLPGSGCQPTATALVASNSRTLSSTRASFGSDEHGMVSSLESASKSYTKASQQRAQGRTCLLTGATSGIGYETLKFLLREGADRIQIVTRNRSRGMDAVKHAIEETGVDSTPVNVLEMHLENLADDQALAPELTSLHHNSADGGPHHIDTFIHCAGRSQSSLSFKTSMNEVQDIIGTNLLSYTRIASQLLHTYYKSLKAMPEEKPSFSVIGVSSLLAVKNGYGASSYAASKAALIAYNRALGLEASAISKRHPKQPKFRVNTVVPGYVDTPMLKDAGGNTNQKLLQEIPLGRFGDPQEIADAIMFLVGNEYAHNCVLNIDGGLSGT